MTNTNAQALLALTAAACSSHSYTQSVQPEYQFEPNSVYHQSLRPVVGSAVLVYQGDLGVLGDVNAEFIGRLAVFGTNSTTAASMSKLAPKAGAMVGGTHIFLYDSERKSVGYRTVSGRYHATGEELYIKILFYDVYRTKNVNQLPTRLRPKRIHSGLAGKVPARGWRPVAE